jgi:alkylation response protein AidB-like acyl-CoA dehydrogenase
MFGNSSPVLEHQECIMDFEDTASEAAFRRAARTWIDENAPSHLTLQLKLATYVAEAISNPLIESKSWQKKKARSGWACLHWPKEYGGRGGTQMERVIWAQEEGVYRALSTMFEIGQGMCGPTLMSWGADALRLKHLPRIASGEEIWCQLFSEPAAGSDLAGVRTRAEGGSGADWIVNGQKTWTSDAQYADFGLLLARTDTAVPKHKGLTMFFVDMRAPGVDVRPIKQINGGASFNEVFFSNLRVPDSQRLGAVGQGWEVALTTLMNERLSIAVGMPTGFEHVMELCLRETQHGRAIDDRGIRTRLANLVVRASGLKYVGMRAVSALSRGEIPGPENSIGKLVAASIVYEVAELAMDIQGALGVITGPSNIFGAGRFQAQFLEAPAARLAGGTDEILRNVIAERVLHLPGDIRVDRDIPFRDIATHAKKK